MHRIAISIRGIAQGVGFRPYVFNLALQHGLAGFVANRPNGILIEAQGARASLEAFLRELRFNPPAPARIDAMDWQECEVREECGFRISESDMRLEDEVFIAPDVATCPACLAELFDPADRRFHYPFLNCAECGPRFTIIRGVPFDRNRTTMGLFPLCPECRREYESPADRRFHAQTIACPVCGPRLELWDSQGRVLLTSDPLAEAIRMIREGRIGALKGLGGFHLICDARNEAAVSALRHRKQRDEKPFAIMVRDAAAAREWCAVSEQERELLMSPERPIVLLEKHIQQDASPAPGLAASVAPENLKLGVMLPYTPLHHLLLKKLNGMPLLMTSGNISDEPIVRDEIQAVAKLGGIADFLLVHNRPIESSCDDSVVRVSAGQAVWVRRSRGCVPAPLPLPVACRRRVLAAGGQMKNTFAFGRGRHGILSQHIGDLDKYETWCAYEREIEHFEKLFSFKPELLAHDLHPDYASTRYAVERGLRSGFQTIPVQHHHAHLAACLADNDSNTRVIGVIFDGTGLGTDGTVWGGEFLVGDCAGFERAGHLRLVPMPGGEAAVREPWRMALAHLLDAGEEMDIIESEVQPSALPIMKRMIESRLNAPLTSSCGRLFDAVAALAGVRRRITYEGQAAMQLEWLASDARCTAGYPFEISGTDPIVVDTRPIISSLARDVRKKVPGSIIARRFHATVAELIMKACLRLRERFGLQRVALSGGVFANAILLHESKESLCAAGFDVYIHRRVPPNDGGLSLGQLAVAAAQEARD